MSEVLERNQILEAIGEILERLASISTFISSRICDDCETSDEMKKEWLDKRKKMTDHLRGLVSKFSFSLRLPRDELGILAQGIISNLLQIQYSFAKVLAMIDMVHGDTFGEIYMDSLTTITSKVHEQLVLLKNMTQETISNQDAVNNTLEAILRLEREIDEANIIICRQISVRENEDGESGFNCYMMRKIVSELEHISDYGKETAEMIADI